MRCHFHVTEAVAVTMSTSPMSYFLVTAASVQGAPARSRRGYTIEEALRCANFMLGNGAAAVWIIDGEGCVVLPADQVRQRLMPRDPGSMASSA